MNITYFIMIGVQDRILYHKLIGKFDITMEHGKQGPKFAHSHSNNAALPFISSCTFYTHESANISSAHAHITCLVNILCCYSMPL